MSNGIICDHCGKALYADSRAREGDYHSVFIDEKDHYHVCRDCYENVIKKELFPKCFNEEE